MPVSKGYKLNKAHKWTEDEKQYLKEICPGKSYKEIIDLMYKRFDYKFNKTQISSALKRYGLTTGRTGCFEKGFTPWNKGIKGSMKPNKSSFKKGHIPDNYKPIGSERIDNKDGYTKVKVADPNVWELKHKVIYEKHYGKIKKKGNVVIFLDGNKSNFDINNLKCITRKQLLVMNRNGLIKEDAGLTNIGIDVANLMIKTNEAKKNINK